MAYDMSSWAPEFWFAEGEPYDSDRGPSERPTSVWQAIVSAQADRAQWQTIARALRVRPQVLTPETVLEAIQAVNTCSNLSSPVEVWVDGPGFCRLKVYETS